MPTAEEYRAVGLYDPDDPFQATRVELLDWLIDQGFSIEALVRADAADSLVAIAGDRDLVRGPRLTRREAIDGSGLDPDLFDAVSTAFGFLPIEGAPPGEVGYVEAEIAALGLLGALSSMFTRDEALALIRVIGSSLGRIAEASVSLFLADVESPHLESGQTELGLAHKVKDAIGLLDGLTEHFDPILRRHVFQATERTRRTVVSPEERLQHRYAVGFLDLVGFTAISADMAPQELGAFARRFEGQAHDIANGAGARVVKLIGDEVMFVATDPGAACRAGLALMDALAGDDDRVVPRGGLAYGNVVLRGGDYFGSVVNLASRLVDQAVPLELLVSEELAVATPDCEFDPAGRRMVKGFSDPVTVRSLRREIDAISAPSCDARDRA